MESGFQNITKEGVLAEESLRGVRFNILDVELHPDAIHRGGGQIIPTNNKKSLLCSRDDSNSKISGTIFMWYINTKWDNEWCLSMLLTKKKCVFNEESVQGTPLLVVKAYLPVAETFWFTAYLRSLTSGQAFP